MRASPFQVEERGIEAAEPILSHGRIFSHAVTGLTQVGPPAAYLGPSS
jgi:hypothetical protein